MQFLQHTPKRVILHCSDTPDYPKDNPAFDVIGASDIRVWHMRDRGWRDIGYHWVIRRSGVIEAGRPEKEVGAHVEGHNTGSIGICYVGHKSPTQAQIDSMLFLYRGIYDRYGIAWDQWFGHCEFNKNKTCPGFSPALLREMVKQCHLRHVG
jgi:N-acetylmuramoyl-L-alanine amidase